MSQIVVNIPSGVPPGGHFRVNYGGQIVTVVTPLTATPGMPMNVIVPPRLAPGLSGHRAIPTVVVPIGGVQPMPPVVVHHHDHEPHHHEPHHHEPPPWPITCCLPCTALSTICSCFNILRLLPCCPCHQPLPADDHTYAAM